MAYHPVEISHMRPQAAACSATAASRSTSSLEEIATASRRSGASAPTSPTRSSSSRPSSRATASSRRCCARRSSRPRRSAARAQGPGASRGRARPRRRRTPRRAPSRARPPPSASGCSQTRAGAGAARGRARRRRGRRGRRRGGRAGAEGERPNLYWTHGGVLDAPAAARLPGCAPDRDRRSPRRRLEGARGAAPERGRANDAVLDAARRDARRCRAASLSSFPGTAARDKVVELDGIDRAETERRPERASCGSRPRLRPRWPGRSTARGVDNERRARHALPRPPARGAAARVRRRSTTSTRRTRGRSRTRREEIQSDNHLATSRRRRSTARSTTRSRRTPSRCSPRSTPRCSASRTARTAPARSAASRSARSGSRRCRGRRSASTTAPRGARVSEPAPRALDVRVGSRTDALTPISVAERSLAARAPQWVALARSSLAALAADQLTKHDRHARSSRSTSRCTCSGRSRSTTCRTPGSRSGSSRARRRS